MATRCEVWWLSFFRADEQVGAAVIQGRTPKEALEHAMRIGAVPAPPYNVRPWPLASLPAFEFWDRLLGRDDVERCSAAEPLGPPHAMLPLVVPVERAPEVTT